MSINDEATNRNKGKHFSVDNSDHQDSKEEESAKTTTTIDITKAGNTSKDILDITDTPDVATWNKGTQIKGNAADIIKRSQESGAEITQGKMTRTNATTIGLKEKGSEDLIIDSANKRDVAKVVNSGTSLTDKEEESFSIPDNNFPDISKKSQKAK
ncbi:MAG: hypothetical protein K0S67_1696 [Nitrososphaeraceae archaeon]|jgi:hypothetical protein|nr:hypothetical protein [Nitrososphaeraceae archaeon]MCD6037808.1 hypothetical protein [Nitrososphaeraceae archaeon]MDF2769032.1 hypothetical protein [Nitrososphaeraceae archaeon]